MLHLLCTKYEDNIALDFILRNGLDPWIQNKKGKSHLDLIESIDVKNIIMNLWGNYKRMLENKLCSVTVYEDTDKENENFNRNNSNIFSKLKILDGSESFLMKKMFMFI